MRPWTGNVKPLQDLLARERTMSKVTTSALTQRFSRRSGIYLVDFAVFKPPDE